MDTVITQAEADHVFDQQELRRLIEKYTVATVLEWVMAVRLGLPLRPYHAPAHGTIGEPQR